MLRGCRIKMVCFSCTSWNGFFLYHLWSLELKQVPYKLTFLCLSMMLFDCTRLSMILINTLPPPDERMMCYTVLSSWLHIVFALVISRWYDFLHVGLFLSTYKMLFVSNELIVQLVVLVILQGRWKICQ